MATLPLGLIEHRRWEDILLMILGFGIMVSPMFVALGEASGNRMMIGATALVGATIIVLAALEQLALRRWEEFLTFICGAYVMVSPFIFMYGGTLRMWHFGLGAAVAVLALLEIWQDRNRNIEA